MDLTKFDKLTWKQQNKVLKDIVLDAKNKKMTDDQLSFVNKTFGQNCLRLFHFIMTEIPISYIIENNLDQTNFDKILDMYTEKHPYLAETEFLSLRTSFGLKEKLKHEEICDHI